MYNNDRKFLSGCVILVDGFPVKAFTKQQMLVALSSAEAELIALTEGAKEAIPVPVLCATLHSGGPHTGAGGACKLPFPRLPPSFSPLDGLSCPSSCLKLDAGNRSFPRKIFSKICSQQLAESSRLFQACYGSKTTGKPKLSYT